MAVLRYNNIYEYFDPYGHVVDKPLRWISAAKRKLLNQGEPLLTELLDRSGAGTTAATASTVYRLTHDRMDLKD